MIFHYISDVYRYGEKCVTSSVQTTLFLELDDRKPACLLISNIFRKKLYDSLQHEYILLIVLRFHGKSILHSKPLDIHYFHRYQSYHCYFRHPLL